MKDALGARVQAKQRQNLGQQVTRNPAKGTDALDRSASGRRPLTVVFCDLASSTVLAELLDPEDLRDFLRTYHQVTDDIVRRFGGTLAQTIGDGLVIAFGWPQAREDDAERAVRASEAMIEAVAKLPRHGGYVPAARIGAATDLALAGVPTGGHGHIDLYGAILTVAARLQTMAEQGQLLITTATRRRLGNRFLVRELGEQALKGFSEPVGVWQVLGENPEGIRFNPESVFSGGLFSGRQQSLAQLLDRWDAAARGTGGVVVIEGEAGVGKSRLVSEVTSQLEDGESSVFHLQCLPLFEGTSLHPVGELLRLRLGPRHAGDGMEAARTLLGLNQAMSIGEAERSRLIDAVADWLLGLGGARPLLLVVEDAHWADPTTLELLDRMAGRIGGHRTLLVATTRSSERLQIDPTHYLRIGLDRLDDGEAKALLASLPGADTLRQETIRGLLARAEGIPLYLEELVQTVRDKGRIELPESLQDAMLSRVESLPGIGKAAEAAAVLSRIATPELVGQVIGAPVGEARNALLTLTGAGILVQEADHHDEERFHFRHALLQDAVYENIPRNRRRALHRRCVDTIRQLRRQMEVATPELLAEHLERAGERLEAAGLWLTAGRRAAARSALHEARRHLERGLQGVSESGSSEEAVDIEVDLNLALAPVLLATQGPSAPEVDRLFTRARALRPRQFDAIWGLWRTETRADKQLVLAEEMERIATAADNRQLLLQAHHAQWATQFNRGDLKDALVHVETGLGLYREELDGRDSARFGGHDPLCCALGVAALCHWAMGRPALARQQQEKAITLARRLGDAHSLAHALDYAMMLAHHQGDLAALESTAREAVTHAERNGLPHYLARARCFLSWIGGAAKPDVMALTSLQQALGTLRQVGDEEDFTLFLDLLAERSLALGREEEALAALDEARASLAQHRGVRYWEPELLRHSALVHLEEGAERYGDAEALLEEARALALARGHVTLALRAALTLAEAPIDPPRHRRRLAEVASLLIEAEDLSEVRRATELLQRP